MNKLIVIFFVFFCEPLFAQLHVAGDIERGKALYTNHCLSCHESTVHVRDHKKAKTLKQLKSLVIRWADTITLNWQQDEINDVTDYLNSRFYGY